MIEQKIYKKFNSPLSLAVIYYSFISAINNLYLSEREIELMAFIAVKGISHGGGREEFINTFHSTKGYINNMLRKLNKQGLLVKINNRIRIVEQLNIDFTQPVGIQLVLGHEQE